MCTVLAPELGSHRPGPFVTDPASTQHKNTVLIPKGSQKFLPKQINKKIQPCKPGGSFTASYPHCNKLLCLFLCDTEHKADYPIFIQGKPTLHLCQASTDNKRKQGSDITTSPYFFCTAIFCMQVKEEQIDTNK